MASFFVITTPTQPIALDAQGRGTVVFSVKNEAPRPVSVRCEALPEGDTEPGWLSIQGSEAVHLEAGETAQMVVAVEAPPGSAPGTYECRLKAYDTERPDENYTVGQSARFVVTGGKPPGPTPKIWVFVVVLAVVLLGGGAVAVWLWLGGESAVETPDLIGRQWAEVDPAALEGFSVVTTEQLTTEAAPGVVLAQFPEAGTSVPRGGELEITLAAAPARVDVRLFVGDAAESARAWAEAQGLVVETTTETSDQPPGTVLAQEPADGALAVGETMHLVVAAPPDDVEVLDFVGSKVRLLQTWAASNEIDVDLSNRPSREAEGTVLEQDPKGGRIEKGGTIQVVAAAPIPPVEVRNFQGLTLEAARAWADERGIELELTETPSDKPAGTVLSQDPAVGQIEGGGVIRMEVAAPEVAVRDFTSSTLRSLEQWAADNGLELEVAERESDEPPGTVLGQRPAGGHIEPGGTIRVAVAVARRTVVVRSFLGSPAEALKAWADQHQIRLELRREESGRPEGTVLSQDPSRGKIDIGARMVATIAVPPAVRIDEDCLRFRTESVELKEEGGGRFLLTDGRSRMAMFPNAAEAKQALRIIRHYRLDSHCFVGRPQPSLEYWLSNGRAPSGAMEGEDAIRFNPSRLEVKQFGSDWKIVEGNHLLFSFPNQAEAELSLKVIRKYGFTHSCFVGRPGPSMQYLRK